MKPLSLLLVAALACIPASGALPPPATNEAQRADIESLRIAYTCGEPPYRPTPANARRLADIWKTGSRENRLAALHDWACELSEQQAPPAECALVIGAARRWGGGSHFCEIERDLFYRVLCGFWSSPDAPSTAGADGRIGSLRLPPHPVGQWLRWAQKEGLLNPEDIAAFYDAIHGHTGEMLANALLPGEREQIEASRIWNDPETYAPLLLAKGSDWGKMRLRRALHDPDCLMEAHAKQGIRRWRYTWGKDLPFPIRKSMELMRERQEGKLPSPADLAMIERGAAALEPAMTGFIPRCQLAADPACAPWKHLETPGASLFLMPDGSAPSLPQWSATLLGSPATPQEDAAALAQLAHQATQQETLPALLAFTLCEADLALPDGYPRPRLNVNGYDTLRFRLEASCRMHGTDLVIDAAGPRFSREDSSLQQAARSLSLALHRCILRLAAEGEREGAGAEGSAALAAVLNEWQLWPLLVNEYELRGIPPALYVQLVSHYEGPPELLQALAVSAHAEHSATIARQLGGGEMQPSALASLMRDEFMLRGDIMAPEEAVASAALRWLRLEQTHPGNRLGATRYLCLCNQVPFVALWADIPSELLSGRDAYTGFSLVRHALDAGNRPRAEEIFARMTQAPDAWERAETHAAHALLARQAGDAATCAREEKNALLLAAIAIHRGGPGSDDAFHTLIDAGWLVQAERMLLLFRSRPEYRVRKMALADAFARARMYAAAAFLAEDLLHESCVNATPSSYLGTQADIVFWRLRADAYRALFLLRRGEGARAAPLLDAVLNQAPAMPKTALVLAPALLSAAELPVQRRHAIRQQWLARLDALPATPATLAAREVIGNAPSGAQAAADERPGLPPGRLGSGARLTSPVYTWHFMEKNQPAETVRASVESAWYEDFSAQKRRIVSSHGAKETAWYRDLLASSQIRLRHPEGRLQTVSLKDLAPEDIDNLIDWKEKNAIRTWTWQYPRYHRTQPAFDGMIVEAGQGKRAHRRIMNGADVSDGKYVVICRPSGELVRLYDQELIAADRPFIETFRTRFPEQPQLRTFPTWRAAQIDAECRGTVPEAHFLGRKGGPEDTWFQRQILDNPGEITELNAQKSLVLCFQDDDGRWDAAGREVMAEAAPWIQGLFPPGTPEEENIYRSGFIVRKQPAGLTIYKGALTPPPPKTGELVVAIRRRNAEKVKELLAANPGLARAHDFSHTHTMLSLAVMHATPGIMAALLDAGANPGERTGTGVPVLAVACVRQKTDAARLLLQRGADPHAEYGTSSGSSHVVQERPIALTRLDASLAELLLEAGASATEPCHDGKTPLVYASTYSRASQEDPLATLPSIDCYLRHGADINERDAHGETPLAAAVRTNCAPLAVELIRRGADPNMPGPQGAPLLLMANSLDVVRALLDGGADIDATPPCSFETALSRALSSPRHNLATVRLLLERHARHDISPHAESFLHRLGNMSWAHFDHDNPEQQQQTRQAILEAARLLIEHGADVNERIDKNTTLLDALSEPSGEEGDTAAHPVFLDLLRRYGAKTAGGRGPIPRGHATR